MQGLSPSTQKRLSALINVAYFIMILAAFYLVFRTFAGILMPFVFAFIFAILLHRPITFFNKKLKIPRSPLSALFVVLILGAVVTLFMLLGMEIAEQIKGFIEFIKLKFHNISGICETLKTYAVNAVGFLPDALRTAATQSITSFFDNLTENGVSDFSLDSIGIDWSSILSKGGGVIKKTVGQLPSVLISILITIIATVFICADYERIRDFILRQVSADTRRKILNTKHVVFGSLRKMLKAYSLIVLITTTELCIGLYTLKLLKIYDSSYIFMIALVIAVIDIVPVLGTGTVLIPWAIYSFITGNIPMGIGLLIIYAIILVIRQIIEPKLVAGQAGLSPIVTITAMYIGTKTLGILGFFILPFAVIVIKQLNDEGIIHLFKTKADVSLSSADSRNGDSPNESGTDKENDLCCEPDCGEPCGDTDGADLCDNLCGGTDCGAAVSEDINIGASAGESDE